MCIIKRMYFFFLKKRKSWKYLYKALKICHSFLLLFDSWLMLLSAIAIVVYVNSIRNKIGWHFDTFFHLLFFSSVISRFPPWFAVFLHNDCLKSDCWISNTFIICSNKTREKKRKEEKKLEKFQHFRRFIS